MHRWPISLSNRFGSLRFFVPIISKLVVAITLVLLGLQLPIAKAQSQAQVQVQAQAQVQVQVQGLNTRYQKTAKFAYMIIQDNNQLTLDAKPHNFAPAVKIFSDRQRLIRPSSLLNEKVAVAYLIDRHNDVSQVWVLTQEEVKQISTKKN
jgi:hypothetical protein